MKLLAKKNPFKNGLFYSLKQTSRQRIFALAIQKHAADMTNSLSWI